MTKTTYPALSPPSTYQPIAKSPLVPPPYIRADPLLSPSLPNKSHIYYLNIPPIPPIVILTADSTLRHADPHRLNGEQALQTASPPITPALNPYQRLLERST